MNTDNFKKKENLENITKSKISDYSNKRNTVPLPENILKNLKRIDNISQIDLEKGYEETIEKSNKEFIDTIFNQIVSENELKSREIIDFCNILTINNPNEENKYADR